LEQAAYECELLLLLLLLLLAVLVILIVSHSVIRIICQSVCPDQRFFKTS
jgi:hypothetical protein